MSETLYHNELVEFVRSDESHRMAMADIAFDMTEREEMAKRVANAFFREERGEKLDKLEYPSNEDIVREVMFIAEDELSSYGYDDAGMYIFNDQH